MVTESIFKSIGTSALRQALVTNRDQQLSSSFLFMYRLPFERRAQEHVQWKELWPERQDTRVGSLVVSGMDLVFDCEHTLSLLDVSPTKKRK